jgi:hypothetical protein
MLFLCLIHFFFNIYRNPKIQQVFIEHIYLFLKYKYSILHILCLIVPKCDLYNYNNRTMAIYIRYCSNYSNATVLLSIYLNKLINNFYIFQFCIHQLVLPLMKVGIQMFGKHIIYLIHI